MSLGSSRRELEARELCQVIEPRVEIDESALRTFGGPDDR